jgi:transposase-like protein
MPVLSCLHQLFNTEQCQAYIHTLRWKERPLQCPRCQSQDIDPWGTYHYRPGCKRYWCNGCQRTFNDQQFPASRVLCSFETRSAVHSAL